MLAHWKENTIQVHSAPFHYVRTGEGSGKPPLVLAHGFSDNGMCWLPVACELETSYDIILPDARGHGLSARLTPGENANTSADLAEFIQALGLEQVIAGGHSMGASTAAELGAKWPHLVRALVLEDPGWRDPEPEPPAEEKEPPPNPWFEWLKSLPEQTVEQVMAKGRADNPTWAEIEMRPWAESKKQLDLNIFQGLRLKQDWREVARAICVPTLLITADTRKGALVSPENALAVVKMNPLIQVAHIPGAGHNIRRENFIEYMAAVKSFLEEVG